MCGVPGKLAKVHFAGLKRIDVQPLSQEEQQAVLDKWSRDAERESIITSTELHFEGGC